MATKKKPYTKSSLIPLSSIVSNPSVKSKGIYAYNILTHIRRQWEASVGRIKEFSFPYKFRDGVLSVAVTDSIWYSEIKFLKKEILEKISAVNSEVTELRFTLTDDKVISPLSPPKELPPVYRALSDNEINSIENTAELIKDPELREIFRNAMSKSLSKG
ncbi:MAG: DUF721 domain-containing protein [Deferribacteraceae bacterium]|jgi:hypothetical protein|nr:DUF721 domain-containing protein [Deferribacteraceae bacterium]